MAFLPVLSPSELYRKYRYGDPGRHNPGPPPMVTDDQIAIHNRLAESYRPVEKYKGRYPVIDCPILNDELLPGASLSGARNDNFRNYRVTSDKFDPLEDIWLSNMESSRLGDRSCRPNSIAQKLFFTEPENLYKNSNCQCDSTRGCPAPIPYAWDQDLSLPETSAECRALRCDLLKNHKDTKTIENQVADMLEDNSGCEEILQYEPRAPKTIGSRNSMQPHRPKSPASAWRVTRTSTNSLPRSLCIRSQSRESGKRDRSCGRGKPPPKSLSITTRPRWSQHWNTPCRRRSDAYAGCRSRSWSRGPNKFRGMNGRGTAAQRGGRRSLSYSQTCVCGHRCIT